MCLYCPVTFPMDIVKTRLQVDRQAVRGGQRDGMIRTALKLGEWWRGGGGGGGGEGV